MRFLQVVAAAILPAIMCALVPAHAEKRVALVIGNSSYTNLPANEQLLRAVNDARAVGGALKSIGFDVMSGDNLNRSALVDKLDEFTRRLASGDTAFFFFSGHGIALSDGNYILPSDIPDVAAEQETRLARAALAEHDIVSDLKRRGVRVAVVVLDACRTNPFSRSGEKGVGNERGLAPPPQVKGVFSLYAASSGQAARDRLSDDDPSPNSVFSRVLAPMLTRPGIDLASLAIEVREEVSRISKIAGYGQEPSYYDETSGGRIYLNGGPSVVDAASPADEVAWSIVKDTKDPNQLRSFIAQYPSSPRRREAEAGLVMLDHVPIVATPPVAPAVPEDASCSGAASATPRCSQPRATDVGRNPYDGYWIINSRTGAGCSWPGGESYEIYVEDGHISGSSGGSSLSGSVSAAGSARWSWVNRLGRVVTAWATLRGTTGSGGFSGAGGCVGTLWTKRD